MLRYAPITRNGRFECALAGYGTLTFTAGDAAEAKFKFAKAHGLVLNTVVGAITVTVLRPTERA